MALLKRSEATETVEQTLADTRKEMGSQKALFCWLERAFDKQKQNYEKTLQSIEEMFRQKRIDDQKLAEIKYTISDLRKLVDLLKLDQNAFLLLLIYLTFPDIVYMDKVTPTNFLYKVLAFDYHTSDANIKKNYHELMHLFHLDRHTETDRNIFQQIVAFHNILRDPITHKLYDFCDILAVMRKDSSLFVAFATSAHKMILRMTFGTIANPLSFASSTMRAEALFLVGYQITSENFTFKLIRVIE